jgi:hypothetical protein
MSIMRHEIRQISDENRGQPIISQAVVHGNVAYFAGITPNPIIRLRDLSAEDLLEERAALSGLTFVDAVGGTAKAPIHRYSFPLQDTDLRGDEDLRSLGGERFGHVEAISLEHRTIDIKKRQDTASFHPEAVFAHLIVPSQVQPPVRADRALAGIRARVSLLVTASRCARPARTALRI